MLARFAFMLPKSRIISLFIVTSLLKSGILSMTFLVWLGLCHLLLLSCHSLRTLSPSPRNILLYGTYLYLPPARAFGGNVITGSSKVLLRPVSLLQDVWSPSVHRGLVLFRNITISDLLLA